MLIIQGLVGPKPRPKGVGDGHPVNIPEPPVNRYQRWEDLGGDSRVPIGRHSSSKLVQFGKSGWAFPAFGWDACELLRKAEAYGRKRFWIFY